MKKVYDLSEYLSNEPTKIKIGDLELSVRDGFNDLLRIDALSNRREGMADTEYFKQFLSISLGDEQASKLIELNLPTNAYFKVMSIIQCVYTGDDSEVVDSKQP